MAVMSSSQSLKDFDLFAVPIAYERITDVAGAHRGVS